MELILELDRVVAVARPDLTALRAQIHTSINLDGFYVDKRSFLNEYNQSFFIPFYRSVPDGAGGRLWTISVAMGYVDGQWGWACETYLKRKCVPDPDVLRMFRETRPGHYPLGLFECDAQLGLCEPRRKSRRERRR